MKYEVTEDDFQKAHPNVYEELAQLVSLLESVREDRDKAGDAVTRAQKAREVAAQVVLETEQKFDSLVAMVKEL